MKLTEVLTQTDLTGFRLCIGYHIELKHGLMGYFPALISKSNEPFVCLSKEAVAAILELLPRRSFKISQPLLLANVKEKLAFCVRTLQDVCTTEREIESLPIVDSADLELMQASDFRWAPGLFSCESEEVIRASYERLKDFIFAD